MPSPYTTEQLSDRQQESYILDGINFSNRNNLGIPGIVDSIKWTAGGVGSETDMTNANYPTYRMYDDRGNIVSEIAYQYGTTLATTYVNININTSVGTPSFKFDHIAILGHNFVSGPLNAGNAGNDATIKVDWQIADDASFTTNVLTGAEITANSIYTNQGTSDVRLVWTNLSVSGVYYVPRFKDVTFFRFRIKHASASTPAQNWIPCIGEIWMGERTAFKQGPLLEYDNEWQSSLVENGTSYTGQTNRFSFNTSQGRRSLKWYFAGRDAEGELAEFNRWWQHTEGGTKPFLFWENITSEPIKTCKLMMVEDPDFSAPLSGYDYRELSLELIEQPPFIANDAPLEAIP